MSAVKNGVGPIGGLTVANGVPTEIVAIESISDWTLRNLSVQDGHWIRHANGGVYRYSSTIGDYVRPWVYDGATVLDGSIWGDVVPSAESTPWIDTVDGGAGGTITSDDTYVHWDADVANAHLAYSSLSHGLTAGQFFIQGLFSASVSSNYPTEALCVQDGTYAPWLQVRNASALANFRTATGTVIGYSWESGDVTAETWVEYYYDTVTAKAWAYTACMPLPCAVVANTACSAGVNNHYFIGDLSASAMGHLTGRQIKAGRY